MKLNEWIDEKVTIDVNTPVFDEKTKKVEVKKVPKTYTERVMYVDPPTHKIVCAKGQHEWYVEDKHRYIFACRNCKRKQIVYPVTYRFESGKLINKETNEIL